MRINSYITKKTPFRNKRKGALIIDLYDLSDWRNYL